MGDRGLPLFRRLTGDPHAAEDLTQETFLRAFRSRGRLREPRAARSYLFRIAVNLWRDQLRRAKLPVGQAVSLAELPDGFEPAGPPPGGPPAEALEHREEVDRVLREMDGLPPRQRQVLHLHAFEGLSISEIAEVLGVTANAVKASLSLARKTLRHALLHRLPAD